MALISQLPKRLRLILVLLAINLIIFTGLRTAFWIAFHTTDSPISSGIILRSFFIGLKFDLRLSLLLVFPLVALSWIPGINPFHSSRGRRLWAGHFAVLIPLITLFYLIDFAHYIYLEERLDASALKYVQNPIISLRMVWETYPVVWGISGLTLFGILLYVVLNKVISKSRAGEFIFLDTWKKISIISLSIFLYLFGIYGKASFYPLRWSDAFFTTHRFSSHVALNPVLFFFDTLSTVEEDTYDKQQVKRHYDRVATYLGVTKPDRDRLVFARRINPIPLVRGKTNVVVIFMESFSAHKTGIFGNPLNPSPQFDAIAKDSLFFKRFYTPRRGTARGVFATLTGIPDIITYRTASRNPKTVSQYTILSSFEDYKKFYFLGGSANWANIRSLFSHNVKGLVIYEEGDYSSPRTDVWGISDLHLFEEANRILSSINDKPFFAFIHSSGNHRPYRIPEDNRNFEMASVEERELNKYGFSSLTEFNSFRFLDHSLGFFMRIASKEEYFKNTLFFIFGDNGTRGKSPHMTAAEESLKLGTYHVPFVIYGPGLIRKGRVFDILATQMDVLPTIAGMTGSPFLNTTLGRNLLDTRFDSQRYAFIETKRGSAPEIGLLSDDFFLVMNVAGTNISLYPYYSQTPTENVGEKFPDQVRQMSQLCLGLYHTSKYLLYNNSPSLYFKDEK